MNLQSFFSATRYNQDTTIKLEKLKDFFSSPYGAIVAFILGGLLVYTFSAQRYICITLTINNVPGCYKYDTVTKKVVGTCPPSSCS